jgi:hypothetical protein
MAVNPLYQGRDISEFAIKLLCDSNIMAQNKNAAVHYSEFVGSHAELSIVVELSSDRACTFLGLGEIGSSAALSLGYCLVPEVTCFRVGTSVLL